MSRSCNQKTVKFSVKEKEGNLEFVHLNQEGKCIARQSGCCKNSMGNRKTVQNLRKLTDVDKVCPHLQITHGHPDRWQETWHESESNEPHRLKTLFNVKTGLWDFGGLSTYIPKGCDTDEYRKSTIDREEMNAKTFVQNSEVYLEGKILKPRQIPISCACGASYRDEAGGVAMEKQFKEPLMLYLPRYVAKCWLYQLKGQSGECSLQDTGENECIYFWFNEKAIAEEVFYKFERLMFKKLTFSSYCEEMTATYNEYSHIKTSFMSKNTFINSFFGWLASMKIDFRQHVDPWCGTLPSFLLLWDGLLTFYEPQLT